MEERTSVKGMGANRLKLIREVNKFQIIATLKRMFTNMLDCFTSPVDDIKTSAILEGVVTNARHLIGLASERDCSGD